MTIAVRCFHLRMASLCFGSIRVAGCRVLTKSCQIRQLGKLYRIRHIHNSLSASVYSRLSHSDRCILKRSFCTSPAFRTSQENPKAQSTIDEEEISKFRVLAEQWWDEVGEFQALHTMNDLRVPLIRDAVLDRSGSDDMSPAPLTGTLILDVGCGGGILAEVSLFRVFGEQWWDEVGEFQALHTMNDLRVPLIRDAVLDRSSSDDMSPAPLTGTLILDVGCGGGILAEPLARLGATVIGVDATEENIPIAQAHVSHDPGIRTRVKYIHGTAEDLLLTEAGTFDVVVASEVLEHVSDVEQLVTTCVDLVKPGGSVIFTTINKTLVSYWIAVVGAEDIFRVVPDGTHDWEKFVTPEKLQNLLEQCGCEVKSIDGMLYNPVTHRWSWTDILACNYAIHAVKPDSTTNIDADEEEIEVNSTTDQKR